MNEKDKLKLLSDGWANHQDFPSNDYISLYEVKVNEADEVKVKNPLSENKSKLYI
jgi:hypothetical protein